MTNLSKIEDTSTIDAIRQVALDYADGWYTGNAERMVRACHDSLVKRTLVRTEDSAGWTTGPVSTKAAMVGWTEEGGGRAWPSELKYEVEVVDVFRDIAMVRCGSPEYVDYLQLAHFGDVGWKIVNVLWQLKEGDFDPSSA